ncbi:MAG: NAD(+)/NADH kinase [Acidimicrobiales bacterium]
MSAIGFMLYGGKAEDLAAESVDWLLDRGHDVRLTIDDAAALGRPDLGTPTDSLAVGADLVLSLGGDGTMLRAVRAAVIEDVPVLGVNVGQLGYLTEVEPDGIRMALKRFLAGSYSIEERMRLDVTVERQAGESQRVGALNEAVVEKADMGHTVRLDVQLDDRPFTSYVCDGLILATPTGSTAYAFSVRGPIIDPRHRAVLMAPVAAHMLFDRPMVLRPDAVVRVTVSGGRRAGLSVDGRPGDGLEPGDSVVCTANDRPARFVTFGENDFHAVLRSKFGLSQR